MSDAHHHSIALPLSPTFGGASQHHDGYSFFATPQSAIREGTTPSYPELTQYLDELTAFLLDVRLVQAHPDHYFQFVCGEKWKEDAVHIDGSQVTAEEVTRTQRLLAGFDGILDGPEAMSKLRRLVSSGPETGKEGSPLQEFYNITRRLMLGRQRRLENDAATLTLTRPAERPPITDTTVAEKARQRQILDVVVSFGMNPKKVHEVAVMQETLSDLLHSVNASCSPSDPLYVQTALNIGEGKGYVSRAVALCDGVQVVGLDCNPAHKEHAVERFESLLESSLSGRREQERINLLYEPRGHVASVACRVEESVDWASLLEGHVRTTRDGSTEDAADALPLAVSGLRLEKPHKLACRVCGKIIRQENTVAIMKHVYYHVREEEGSQAEVAQERAKRLGLPDAAQVSVWNQTLSQHLFAARLTEQFFTFLSTEVELGDAAPCSCHPSAEKKKEKHWKAADASAPGEEGVTEQVVSVFEQRAPWLYANGGAAADIALLPARIARGYRALVLLPLLNKVTREWTYVETRITIIGYNGARDEHHVYVGDGTKKVSFHLVRHPDAAALLQSAELPPAAEWGLCHIALVVAVVPPAQPNTPAVAVPSLRNTLMIGLHPCGDLGSNVCRIFSNSESRGLLLVSCCWHALTHDGFPLSSAIRQRGLTVDKVSLLLATQPLDVWSNASPQGHRSSAKILFFRSLLKLLWIRLGDAWATAPEKRGSLPGDGHVCTCVFDVASPYLEPAFLRKVTRDKETLTFVDFVALVCREYLFTEDSKHTAYTPFEMHNVCAPCRAAQEAFLHRVTGREGLAQQLQDTYMPMHFPRFLGMTVLRMWMCHLVESLFLIDRTLYLHETLSAQSLEGGSASTAVSLVPLFDGAVSPRMYGILARRGGSAS